MVLRLGKLTDWKVVKDEEDIVFTSDRPRIVKMAIRTEVRQSMYIDTPDWSEFLCIVDGYQEVEFTVEGVFSLRGEGGFSVLSADSTYVGIPNTDEEVFTRMHEKRPIAPEILAMQKVMAKNMDRLKADIRRDMEGMERARRRQERREAELAAEIAAAAAEAGAGTDEGSKSSPAPVGGGAGEKPASDPAPKK